MHTDFRYMKMLIVEDDEYVANIIKVVLMAFGVEQTYVCTSFEAAKKVLQEHPLNCVFVDYMMKPVGGMKLIHHIRHSKDDVIAELPIILCTVYTDYDKVVEARDAGVSEIMAKPITPMCIFQKTTAAIYKARKFIRSANYIGPCRRRRNLPWIGKKERRRNADAMPLGPETIPVHQGRHYA